MKTTDSQAEMAPFPLLASTLIFAIPKPDVLHFTALNIRFSVCLEIISPENLKQKTFQNILHVNKKLIATVQTKHNFLIIAIVDN